MLLNRPSPLAKGVGGGLPRSSLYLRAPSLGPPSTRGKSEMCDAFKRGFEPFESHSKEFLHAFVLGSTINRGEPRPGRHALLDHRRLWRQGRERRRRERRRGP